MANNKKVITEDKKENKIGKFFRDIIDLIIKHLKIIMALIIILVLFIVIGLIVKNAKLNTKIITIDGTNYTRSDFNIYLYSAKYNYFKDNTDITEDDLKVIYDNDTNMTVGEYLKEVTLSDIKTANAILRLANDNNIELTESDLEKIEADKKQFIDQIGGKRAYRRLLRKNKTTDESYNQMVQIDALYRKVLQNLYSDGAINDLTEEEKELAKISYKDNYFQIKQIILTIVDLDTGKSLDITTINQKKALAETIVEKAKNTDFDELIKKYSEDSTDKNPPYALYYKKGDLLDELEEATINSPEGNISAPIKTKYAYHIIKREHLDDSKFTEYLDSLREDKCIEVLRKLIEEEKIVYQDAYKKIEIK